MRKPVIFVLNFSYDKILDDLSKGKVMTKMIFWGLYLVFTQTYAQNKNGIHQFNLEKPLQSLEISTTKGTLTISQGDKDKAVVEVKKVKWAKSCEESVVQFGPSLTVKIKSSTLFNKDECQVDLTIKIPKSVDMDIANGSMLTIISGIEGNLNYRSANGDLKAQGLFPKVDIKVASSDVMIDGLSGEGVISGASTDMKLIYSRCPLKPARLSLNRASGDVEIFIPKFCKLKTQNKTASGDSFNEFGDSVDYNLEIASVSASGDFTIKKLK